jgi:hypothetical protein
MIAVQAIAVKREKGFGWQSHGKGLGWQDDGIALASCAEKELAAQFTRLEITVKDECLSVVLNAGVRQLRSMGGVIGQMESATMAPLKVWGSGTREKNTARLCLLNETDQVVVDMVESEGYFHRALDRYVSACATSGSGSTFWVTNPSLAETIVNLARPARRSYGFASEKTFFDDPSMVAAVLLYELVFQPQSARR